MLVEMSGGSLGHHYLCPTRCFVHCRAGRQVSRTMGGMTWTRRWSLLLLVILLCVAAVPGGGSPSTWCAFPPVRWLWRSVSHCWAGETTASAARNFAHHRGFSHFRARGHGCAVGRCRSRFRAPLRRCPVPTPFRYSAHTTERAWTAGWVARDPDGPTWMGARRFLMRLIVCCVGVQGSVNALPTEAIDAAAVCRREARALRMKVAPAICAVQVRVVGDRWGGCVLLRTAGV